jgi:ABC-2 type transport system permease protein
MADTANRAPFPPLASVLRGQLAHHIRLVVRTPRAVFGGLLLPLVLLALRPGHADVAGVAIVGVLSTAYTTHASGLVAARQLGVLKRWRAAPVPAWCWFAGRIGASVLLATASGTIAVLAGALLDGVGVGSAELARLVPVFAIGAACWAAVGTAASAFIPTTEAAWPLLGATYLPLLVLSGSFGPIGGEPGGLTTVVADLPVRPVVAAASGAGFSVHGLVVLAAWTAAAFLVAQRWFRWEPRATQ